MVFHRIAIFTVQMFNSIQTIFLIVEPLVLYFPAASSRKYHFLQISLCQFYTTYPLKAYHMSLSFLLGAFVFVFEYIHDFLFPSNIFHMIRITPTTMFLSQSHLTFCSFSCFYPFKSFCQIFLPFLFLCKQVFPMIFTALFHKRLCRI